MTAALPLLHSHSAPVVDLTHWKTRDEMLRASVARQVEIAARDYGFFYVSGHGIPADVIARADNAMREFFSLPDQVKQQIAADKTRALKTTRGYAGLRDEQLDATQGGRPDFKEVLDLGLPLGDTTQTYLGPNLWPEAMPHMQNDTEPYLKASLELGSELLSIVARSIGLPEKGFAEVFDEPLVVQRLMRYPPKANMSIAEPGELGCGAHYDFGGLTLLHQSDATGLQVQPPANSHGDGDHVNIDSVPYSTTRGTFYSDLHNRHSAEWMPVVAHPGLLVVTFGEAMQRLTNGVVQATRHRVVHNGSEARHSMAVFLDPNPHRKIFPLPQLKSQPPRYAARTAGHKTVLLAATVALQQRSGSSGS